MTVTDKCLPLPLPSLTRDRSFERYLCRVGRASATRTRATVRYLRYGTCGRGDAEPHTHAYALRWSITTIHEPGRTVSQTAHTAHTGTHKPLCAAKLERARQTPSTTTIRSLPRRVLFVIVRCSRLRPLKPMLVLLRSRSLACALLGERAPPTTDGQLGRCRVSALLHSVLLAVYNELASSRSSASGEIEEPQG
jgi:hypothetical protein